MTKKATLLVMLSALPTWALTNLFTLFLRPSHPWAGRFFRLRAWAPCRTDVCKTFDLVFWICGINLAILAYRIFNATP